MRRAAFALWVGALSALCAPAPAAAQNCVGGSVESCIDSLYSTPWYYLSAERVADWSVAVAAAKWNPDPDCQNVKAAAVDAFKRSHHFVSITGFSNVEVFVHGEFRDSVTAGIHWLVYAGGSVIDIFGYDSTMTEAQYWETTKHEAAHHAGVSDTGSFNAYTAEQCATRDKQKEKKLKAGQGGGGGGGGYWYYRPPVYKWVCESVSADECVSSPDPPYIDCGEIGTTVNCHLVKVSDGGWVWVDT